MTMFNSQISIQIIDSRSDRGCGLWLTLLRANLQLTRTQQASYLAGAELVRQATSHPPPLASPLAPSPAGRCAHTNSCPKLVLRENRTLEDLYPINLNTATTENQQPEYIFFRPTTCKNFPAAARFCSSRLSDVAQSCSSAYITN